MLSCAGDGCDPLLEAKQKTYGFSPSSLSQLEKTAKIRGLDRFWKLAERDPKQSAGCLVAMLEEDRKDSYFLFDGSQLLFSLAKSAKSAEVVAGALAQVNLDDIKPYDYVALAIEASKAGAGISSAAMNFARATNVEDYRAGSGVVMNRERGTVALFGRLPVEDEVANAKALFQSGGPAASPYGLLLLALALTPDALAVVKQAGDMAAIPAPIRRQLSTLISRNLPRARSAPVYQREQLLKTMKSAPNYPPGLKGPAENEDFMASAFSELQAGDAAVVREARRRSIVDPSAASLIQYYAYTHILHVVETKAGLFDSSPTAVQEQPAPEKKSSPARKKTRQGRKKITK